MTDHQQELLHRLTFIYGIPHEKLLGWIISNYMSQRDATQALELAEMEFTDYVFHPNFDVEEEHDDHYNDSFYDKETDVELDD